MGFLRFLPLVLAFAAGAARAATWYVADTGSDAGAGTTNAPYASLTHALAQAAPGDLIAVAAGVYTQTVAFPAGKSSIAIRGGYASGDWAWAPSGNVSVLRVTNAAPVTLAAGANDNTLAYLTIVGGRTTFAGIQILGGVTNLLVEGCTVVSNLYGVNGAGGSLQAAVFRNTVVALNKSHGLIFSSATAPPAGFCSLYNCTVAGNGGSGFYTSSGHANWGGIKPVAKNCLFTGNGAYGIYKAGAGAGSMQNCLFFGNTNGPTYGTTSDLGGNKSGRDPKYVSAAEGDFRVADDSPAAAAGLDLSTNGVVGDRVGAARPVGGAWDMGAYQGGGTGELPLALEAWVSPNGSNAAGDGTATNPWASVDFALGRVTTGGFVRVAAGTYVESVHFGAEQKGITVRGGYDPTTWAWAPAAHPTTIDGRGNGPLVFASGANSNTVGGLTLTGGGTNFAGVRVLGSLTGFVVEGCTIVRNRHGVEFVEVVASGTVRNSVLAGNRQCGVYGATGGNQAGGTCTLLNCTVAGNGSHGYLGSAGNGNWGFFAVAARNCLFTDNGGYGLYRQSGASVPSMAYCLFYNNASGATVGAISDLGGNKAGRDPRYVAAAAGDYRLQDDSPAAAAGTNLFAQGVTNDLAGVARPAVGAWDMGAYQGSGVGEAPLPVVAYVRPGGDDVLGDGSAAKPWATVGYALDRVASTGTVRVGAGAYAEAVVFGPGRRAITVRGGYDPATWAWDPARHRTILDGGGRVPVLLGSGAESNTLAYLTLTGGGTNSAGVALSGPAAYLLIDGCTIVGNRVGVEGGTYLTRPTLRNTVVARNASHGLSFGVAAGACLLYNCTVAGNGGAGFMGNSATNQADVVPIVRNSLFTDNVSYGIYKGGNGVGAVLQNSLLYNNAVADQYGSVADLGSNLYVNPRYANGAAGDYRLQAGSPAADNGADLAGYGVTLDIEGHARPRGPGFERGAYETIVMPGGLIFSLR